jgi:hypothetical protein
VSDRGYWWRWLLLVPILVPLATPLYSRVEPRLAGFPFFYWFQLSLIVLAVATTYLVHRVTK